MALHSFIEYLKYQWKAKGRHGTHSPFVYDLIDNVLLDKDYIRKEDVIQCPAVALKYENLICRIAVYYNYKDIVQLPGAIQINTADLLIINGQPNEWAALFNEHIHCLKNESAVIITGIHKTPAHSTAWKKIATHDNVRMSIDLYGIGLLFFKEEFKENQHFILKY